MQLKIREANLEDLKQINEIAKQVQDLHVILRPDQFCSREIIISEERFHEVLKDSVIFIGEINGQINAYAICLIKPNTNPMKVDKTTLFIDSIGVRENIKHSGLGKQLMNHIINYAKEHNCQRIELGVITENKNAIGFYEHLGMKEQSKKMELDI